MLALSAPTLEEVRSIASRRAIERALQRNRGRLIDAARELDVSRVTLYRLMVRYGLRDTDEVDETLPSRRSTDTKAVPRRPAERAVDLHA
jgi:hypothetical protein